MIPVAPRKRKFDKALIESVSTKKFASSFRKQKRNAGLIDSGNMLHTNLPKIPCKDLLDFLGYIPS